MTRLRQAAGALLVGLLIPACSAGLRGHPDGGSARSLAPRDATVVLLVRHAEKASGAPNTDLDPDAGGAGTGLGRAGALAAVAAGAGVEVVYSTDFCRTAQTAQPAAAALGLPIHVMRTGSGAAGLGACAPAIEVPFETIDAATPAAVAQHVLANHAGRVVLVVGHSNTVPALAEAFGAPPLCPAFLLPVDDACHIPEDEYAHVFTVTVPAAGGTPAVEHTTYGAP